MSTDIERRVGNLLNMSQSTGASAASLASVSTDMEHKISTTTIKSASQQTDTSKEKLSVVLKERQELEQVSKHLAGFLTIMFCLHLLCHLFDCFMLYFKLMPGLETCRHVIV